MVRKLNGNKVGKHSTPGAVSLMRPSFFMGVGEWRYGLRSKVCLLTLLEMPSNTVGDAF